jgi:hypothetical protein
MIHVPLQPTPNQTLAITLGGQPCQIALRYNGGPMFLDLSVGGAPVVTCRICRNLQRLLLDAQYHGFAGDFVFVDSQGDTDPTYLGLDSRYRLYYLAASELPTS